MNRGLVVADRSGQAWSNFKAKNIRRWSGFASFPTPPFQFTHISNLTSLTFDFSSNPVFFLQFASNLVSLSSTGAGGGPLDDVNFTRIMLKLKNTTVSSLRIILKLKFITLGWMISNYENHTDPAEAEIYV